MIHKIGSFIIFISILSMIRSLILLRIEMKLLKKISKLSDRDISDTTNVDDLGHRIFDWEWRYEEFRRISLPVKMVIFWRWDFYKHIDWDDSKSVHKKLSWIKQIPSFCLSTLFLMGLFYFS